mgnify:FL=1
MLEKASLRSQEASYGFPSKTPHEELFFRILFLQKLRCVVDALQEPYKRDQIQFPCKTL